MEDWITCQRCETDDDHAPYDYGPWPWVWCHETNSGHDDDEQHIFLIGCNFCRTSELAEGEDPERWRTFLAHHRHGLTESEDVAYENLRARLLVPAALLLELLGLEPFRPES